MSVDGDAEPINVRLLQSATVPELTGRRRLAELAILLIAVTILFTLVGRWGEDANPDAAAVALPAWSFAEHGTFDLTDVAGPKPWTVEVDSGEYSNRPPGLIALAIPAYLAFSQNDFSNAPATLVALATTVAALAVTWLVLERHVASGLATSAVAVLALGTTTWVISSAQIWPHGPGQLMMALALLGLAREKYLGTGFAMAGALLIRPITAVMSAVIGVLESLRQRSFRPAVLVGAPSIAALGLLMAYNRTVFGTWSVRGGYPDSFTSGAVERFDSWSYLSNLFEMFFGFPNGLFLFTPVIAVCVYGAWRARNSLPSWAISAAWAALLYLIVHAFLNRASGGLSMFYRYPLESIVLAMPVLTLGAQHLKTRGRLATNVLLISIAFSIGFQLFAVFGYTCTNFSPTALACQIG